MEAEVRASVRLQEAAADLLMKIKHTCRSTQKAVDCLVDGVNGVLKIYLEVVKDLLHRELSCMEGYISLRNITSTIDSFQDQSIFEGLSTCAEVDSYLRETSGGEEVILEQSVIKYKMVMRKGQPVRVPAVFGYFVKFLPQLEQLLNCPDILECIDNPLPAEDGVYRTVLDGLFYKYHPIKLEHGPQTLAFLMHVDDAEICDSLKSAANKHSFRLMYWMLGNIHPSKRSVLKAVNLLAIANAKVAKKYGNNFLLGDFIHAMKLLGTEGVEFIINGKPRRFYGLLLCACCDNPAAANLGGFKETHSATHPCRNCMVTSSKMCDSFKESIPLLRKLEDYQKQLKQLMALKGNNEVVDQPEIIHIYSQQGEEDLEDDANGEDVLEETDFKTASKNFGINGPSILSEAPFFDCTKCLPQDLMHVANEGIVENVCRLILKDLCLPPAPRRKPIMALQDLNDTIQKLCDFGHLNVSRPAIIEKGHITGSKLKQSASQMMVLMRVLPFIVYGRLPDAKLNLVLKLNQLMDALLAFEFNEPEVNSLEPMIVDFGTKMKEEYPKQKTLKLHSLSHLKTQTKMFGPLRQQTNFCFERMHAEFTSIFPIVKSMKNAPVTAATRHLCKRNYEIKQGKETGNYLCSRDKIVSPEDVPVSSLPEMANILSKIPNLLETSLISRAKAIERRGSTWGEGVCILVDKENNLFGRISNVYVLEDNDILITYNLLMTNWISQYNAFEIKQCSQENCVIKLSELQYKFPMLRFSFGLQRGLKAYILPQKPFDNYC